MSTITVPNREHIATSPPALAEALIAVATAAAADIDALGGPVQARAVVAANVANLAAFTVAGNDGVTLAEGEAVLLVKQTTAAENGLYVVGVVGAGTAALTRHPAMAAAAAIVPGTIVEVAADGTLYGGSTWKAMVTGAGNAYGTNDPKFYPRKCGGTVALVLGTKTLGSTNGLWLFSTTKSQVQVTYNTPNTVAASGGVSAPVASRTAGIIGTAALIINAVKAADDTVDTNNISSVDWLVENW
jgi:hypothetical protein